MTGDEFGGMEEPTQGGADTRESDPAEAITFDVDTESSRTVHPERRDEPNSGDSARRPEEEGDEGIGTEDEGTGTDDEGDTDERTDESVETRPGAIVVGASSGIGEALARELSEAGYELGLASRRTGRLKVIGEDLPTKAYVATIDLTHPADARQGFFQLAEAMGSVDVVIISSGIARGNQTLEWEPERDTVEVNVSGFTAIATAALEHFEHQPDPATAGDGQLVGISSVASRFGNGVAPAYNASKAYVSTYLEGLRYRQAGRESDVTITTIEPGYVDTDLAMGDFWKCSPETAAKQIHRAIRTQRRHAYVTRRWRLVSWALGVLPERLLVRLFA